jgi:hypothetical protein
MTRLCRRYRIQYGTYEAGDDEGNPARPDMDQLELLGSSS